MKFSLNKFIVSGRCGQEPELRYTPNGDAVANFSLAVTYGEKVGDKWENKTNWWRVNSFGKTAEEINKSVVKGQEVDVCGEAVIREYVSKEGEKKYSFEIRYADVSLRGAKKQPVGDGVTPIETQTTPDEF